MTEEQLTGPETVYIYSPEPGCLYAVSGATGGVIAESNFSETADMSVHVQSMAGQLQGNLAPGSRLVYVPQPELHPELRKLLDDADDENETEEEITLPLCAECGHQMVCIALAMAGTVGANINACTSFVQLTRKSENP